MNNAEEFLKRIGLNLDELDSPGHTGEKEAYFKMLQDSKKSILTMENLKGYFHLIRDCIERQLIDTSLNKNQDIFLKARLENMRLIEEIILHPESASKVLDESLRRK